jgi:hypothetical protein
MDIPKFISLIISNVLSQCTKTESHFLIPFNTYRAMAFILTRIHVTQDPYMPTAAASALLLARSIFEVLLPRPLDFLAKY